MIALAQSAHAEIAVGRDGQLAGDARSMRFTTDLTAHHELRPGETTIVGPVGLAGSVGAVSYQWFHHGAPIPGATSDTLTVTDMTETDLGTYPVLVDDARDFTPLPSSRVRLVKPDWPMWGFDAESGEVQWVNDTISTEYVALPHGGAYGCGGLAPQGYIAARDRLFVTTEAGTLYCFGPEKRTPVHQELTTMPAEPRSDRWTSSAAQWLQTLGESEGYALMLGVGSGDLLRELLARSDLHIVVTEAEGKPLPPTGSEFGTHALQMFQGLPESLLGHARVATPVGVREVVATGRGCPTDRRQRTSM